MNLPAPPLRRLGEPEPAGLWITSLPWPRAAAPARVTLEGQPTFGRAIGRWPGSADQPRRLLLVADGGDRAPDELRLADLGGTGQRNGNGTGGELPAAEFERFARSDDPDFTWERHRLRLRHGGRSVALAMGLRTGGAVHWWEGCRLVELERTSTCRVVEMAGAIPLVPNDRATLQRHPNLSHPFLHKHNWLYGRIYARLHSNGVCEIFAHHINSKYVDDGADLEDAVPVIGLYEDGEIHSDAPDGAWDGQQRALTVGDVRFDLTDAAHLAAPDQPGRFDRESDGFLVWQPYEGCELFGGKCPRERHGDEFIYRAAQRIIPRGMARTVRFSLSLSDRSPRVARYVAPSWWYGLCEEFHGEALLPVSTEEWEQAFADARAHLFRTTVQGGFEDGSAARGGIPKEEGRPEPSWEGELPHGAFLRAWRTGDAELYDLAMRSAYYIADVSVDHSMNLVRMHGYEPVAFALPMGRVQAAVAAYLETGDPYLLETAEAVVEASYRLHKNAWPRMAVGRDAMAGRSAVLLYRYFGKEHFREIGRDFAMAVVESQRDNGSFGDQGGGTGIHLYSGYVTKPWMGLMATNVVVDYLELFPDEPRMRETVRRFADWLMAERVEREGVLAWAYQHDYDGRRTFRPRGGDPIELPTGGRWHHDTLARLLGYAALAFDEPKYLDAWAESISAGHKMAGDHPIAAAYQFVPWVLDRLWRAVPGDAGRIRVSPYHFGPRTPRAATIATPAGPVQVGWSEDGQVRVGENVEVAARGEAVVPVVGAGQGAAGV